MIESLSNFRISRVFVFVLFLLMAVYVALLQYFKVSELCSAGNTTYVDCINNLAVTRDYALFMAVLLSPFFVTLLFRYKVFLGWAKLALVTIPITLILTAYILSMPDSGWMPSGAGAFFLLILYGTYLILSLLAIGIAWWRSRGD